MAMYYDYKELRAAAIAPGASAEAINALGEWFELYGMDCWNGECWDADGKSLYPIIEWDAERDQGETVGYEFR